MLHNLECVNLEVLKQLPVIEVKSEDLPLGPMPLGTTLPPDYPFFCAQWYEQENKIVMKDDEGVFHEVANLPSAWEMRKPFPLDHPDVQKFIERMKSEYQDTFVHPKYGIFRLDFFEHDLLRFNATPHVLSQEVPTKEELEPYAIPENDYSTQLIRRYYPDYQP